MGVRIVGQEDEAQACLYDSVTGLAFGPVFASTFEAEEFATHWYTEARDLRAVPIPELIALVDQYHAEQAAEAAEEVATFNRSRHG